MLQMFVLITINTFLVLKQRIPQKGNLITVARKPEENLLTRQETPENTGITPTVPG